MPHPNTLLTLLLALTLAHCNIHNQNHTAGNHDLQSQAHMGGYQDIFELDECNDVFFNAKEKLHQMFHKHEIVFCWKEIVDGFNYKFMLENDDSDVPTCDLIVHQDFRGGVFTIKKKKAGEEDCYLKLRKHLVAKRDTAKKQDL